MRTNVVKVVHVSPRVQAHGGIEALHLLHRTLPLAQEFVALFDRNPASRESYRNLNFTWRTTLGEMRRSFAQALAPHAGSVVIYHNAWGLPLLHGGDRALRRAAFCHAMPAYHADLRGSSTLVDGVFGVTPALRPAWKALLPELDHQRTCVLPLPISPPPDISVKRNPEIVLGYAGRVVKEHKRLDRLPKFLRAMDEAGLHCRFEVVGDGPLRAPLQKQLGERVRFHGWVPKTEFWRILAQWDAIVFFTEVEGGPIAMLEGMAMGALPFFPKIGGSVGDLYAPQVDAACHYPSGDIATLAKNVRDVFRRPPMVIESLRVHARALVASHRPEDYGNALIAHVNRIVDWPRVSVSATGTRRHWSDILPLGLVTRIRPRLLWQRN